MASNLSMCPGFVVHTAGLPRSSGRSWNESNGVGFSDKLAHTFPPSLGAVYIVHMTSRHDPLCAFLHGPLVRVRWKPLASPLLPHAEPLRATSRNGDASARRGIEPLSRVGGGRHATPAAP